MARGGIGAEEHVGAGLSSQNDFYFLFLCKVMISYFLLAFTNWTLQIGELVPEIKIFPLQIHPGLWHAILSFSICGCVYVCVPS